SQGFALEAGRLKQGKDEFLFLERVRYLSAIEDARSCLERARAALASVCAHLKEREEQRCRIGTEAWGKTEAGALRGGAGDRRKRERTDRPAFVQRRWL